jgi:beta-glucosidase
MILLRSVILTALACAGSLSLLAHSAVEPAPRTDAGWTQRQESLNKSAAEGAGRAQVVFIGDSITQGWEGAGKEVWARYYTHRNAVNLGIGGDRTQHVLWRLENGNLPAGLKPKAAVVMIGTNNSNGEDNSVEQIAEGVAAIVSKLRARLPDTTVLLVPIFPRGENANAQRGKVAQVNQIVQKLVDGKSVRWVDFGHRFIDSKGVIPRDLMPDFLHLSPAAYGIWAESLEPQLSAILGDTPITPGSATSAANFAGEWTLTIPGPNDEPVDMAMTLRQDGSRITGSVPRREGGMLEIVDGKADGDRISWAIHRDRPNNGGRMTYRMSGQLKDGILKGKTETEFNGNPMSNEWTAKRK